MLAVVCGLFVMASAKERPADPQGGATITGKIKFTGTKPANPKIDMSEEPKCKAKYQTPPTEEIVVVNPNGTLANVFYVKSGLPESYKAPAPAGGVTLIRTGVATIRTCWASWWANLSSSRTPTASCTTSKRRERRTAPSTSVSQPS